MAGQKFVVEIEREDDGRWIAEVLALPGVIAYGVLSGNSASMITLPLGSNG